VQFDILECLILVNRYFQHSLVLDAWSINMSTNTHPNDGDAPLLFIKADMLGLSTSQCDEFMKYYNVIPLLYFGNTSEDLSVNLYKNSDILNDSLKNVNVST
jgi:hypothetical protein